MILLLIIVDNVQPKENKTNSECALFKTKTVSEIYTYYLKVVVYLTIMSIYHELLYQY